MVGLREEMVAEIRPSLLVLQGCVLLIVLIGCANVANLLLARSTARRREMAVRQALGASRARLVGQLLTESALLAAAGGACGLLLAMWCLPALERIGSGTIPELARLDIDWTVAGFAAAVSLATGLLFGMAPALEVSGISPMEGMRDARGAAAGGSHRRRDALVVAETAVTLVLILCAGLLLRSFPKLQAVDPGFQPRPDSGGGSFPARRALSRWRRARKPARPAPARVAAAAWGDCGEHRDRPP